MRGYKAFNKGLKCKEYEFEVGIIHEQKGRLEICGNGFHFCENPLDTLNYYDLCGSEFAIVEALGEVQTVKDKSATNKIKIVSKLNLAEFISESIAYLQEKTSGDNSKIATSGYYSKVATSGDDSQVATSGYGSQVATSGNGSQVATSGYGSQVATSGNGSQVATSGDDSQVATSGDNSKIATSGYYSKVATSGDDSQVATSGYGSQVATSGNGSQVATSGYGSQVATSGNGSQVATSGKNCVIANIGKGGIAKGVKGCWITLAEYEYGIVKCVKTVQIDGEKIKENTFYQLKNKKFVEVE